MCNIKVSGFSTTSYTKEFKKSEVIDKNNTKDNVIDLTDPARLKEEFNQGINSLTEDKVNIKFLKVDNDSYLKLDLNSPAGKELFNKLKNEILNDSGEIRKNFLKLNFSDSTGIEIEKSDIVPEEKGNAESLGCISAMQPGVAGDVTKGDKLTELDLLASGNKDVAKFVGQLDLKGPSSLSLNHISKDDIAHFVVNGNKPPNTNIQNMIEFLGKTGESSALNVMTGLNNARKAYLEKQSASIDKKIELNNTALSNAKSPEEAGKIKAETDSLLQVKNDGLNELNKLSGSNSSTALTAFKTRSAYSSNRIVSAEKSLGTISTHIKDTEEKILALETKIKLESLAGSPDEKKDKALLEKEKSQLKELNSQATHQHNIIREAHADLEGNSKYMEQLISEKEKKGGKISDSVRMLATNSYSATAKADITIGKIETKETIEKSSLVKQIFSEKPLENNSFHDGKIPQESIYFGKADQQLAKIVELNPDFGHEIKRPVTTDPAAKKAYDEKVAARTEYHDLFQQNIKETQAAEKIIMEKSGSVYNKNIGGFESFSPDKNGAAKDLTPEQSLMSNRYLENNGKLLKHSKAYAKILNTELEADKNIDSLPPEEQSKNKEKLTKIIGLHEEARDVSVEIINAARHNKEAEKNKASLDKNLLSAKEQLSQTIHAPDDHTVHIGDSFYKAMGVNMEERRGISEKTDFDYAVAKRDAIVADEQKLEEKYNDLQNDMFKMQKSVKGDPELFKKLLDSPFYEDKQADLDKVTNSLNMLKGGGLKIAQDEVDKLYDQHKKLAGISDPGQAKQEKSYMEYRSKVANEISQNKARIDELTGKIDDPGFFTMMSTTMEHLDERNDLREKNEKALKHYQSLEVLKPVITKPAIPPEGSVEAITLQQKNAESNLRQAAANEKAVTGALQKTGIIKPGEGIDIDKLSQDIKADFATDEKLIHYTPKYTENNRDFKNLQDKAGHQLAIKRAETAGTFAYVKAEHTKQEVYNQIKEKPSPELKNTHGVFYTAYLNTKEKMNEKMAVEISEKQSVNAGLIEKQNTYIEAYNTFQEAELKAKEIKYDIKAELKAEIKGKPDAKTKAEAEAHANAEILQLTTDSVKSGNILAVKIADGVPENSVLLLKNSAKLANQIEPGIYKMKDGTVIDGSKIAQELHDDTALHAAQSFGPALNKTIEFPRKNFVISRKASNDAAQDLLDISISQAKIVTERQVPQIEENIIKLGSEIKMAQEKLVKLPPGSPLIEKEQELIKAKTAQQALEKKHLDIIYKPDAKIAEEIKEAKKILASKPPESKEYKEANENLELLKTHGAESKGAAAAYKNEANFNEDITKAIEDGKQYSKDLAADKKAVMSLIGYHQENVVAKSDEHNAVRLYGSIFNGKKFDIDNLDKSGAWLGEKFDRQGAQVAAFDENLENARNNHQAARFISVMRDLNDAKGYEDTNPDYYKNALSDDEAYLKNNKLDAHLEDLLVLTNNPNKDNPLKDPDYKQDWDPTLALSLSRGAPSGKNNLLDAEKSIKESNGTLVKGGYQKELAVINDMDGAYSKPRLTEMFNIDIPKFNTGWDALDDSVNSVGRFLDNPETVKMIIETAVLEVATAGIGSVIAFAAEIKEAVSAVKLIEKISEAKNAERVVEVATEGLRGAEEALEAAKAGRDIEKIAEATKNLKNAEKTFDVAKITEVEKIAEAKKASQAVNKVAEVKAKEFAAARSMAEMSKSAKVVHAVGEGAVGMAKQEIENKIIDKTVGADSKLGKVLGFFVQTNHFDPLGKFTNTANLIERIGKNVSVQIVSGAAAAVAGELYAHAKFGKSLESLSAKEQEEAQSFGELVNTATNLIMPALHQGRPSPKEMAAGMIDHFSPDLKPGTEKYKDLSSSLEEYHRSAKNAPDTALENLSKVKAKIEEHFPEGTHPNERKRADEFLQNEAAGLVLSQIKTTEKSNPAQYGEIVKKQLEEYNRQNPEIKLEQKTIDKTVKNEIVKKAVAGVEPLNIEPEKLNTDEGKREFASKINQKKNEFIEKLSEIMPKEEALVLADLSIKIYTSHLTENPHINPEIKAFLEKVIEELVGQYKPVEGQLPKSSHEASAAKVTNQDSAVKSIPDTTGPITEPEVKPNLSESTLKVGFDTKEQSLMKDITDNSSFVKDFESNLGKLSTFNNEPKNSPRTEIESSVRKIINDNIPSGRKKELLEGINKELETSLQRRDQQLEAFQFVKENYHEEINALKSDLADSKNKIRNDAGLNKEIDRFIIENPDIKNVLDNHEKFLEVLGSDKLTDTQKEAVNKITSKFKENVNFKDIRLYQGEIERFSGQLVRTEKGINKTEFDRVAEYAKAIQRDFGNPSDYKGYNKLINDVIQSNPKFKETFPTLEAFHIAIVRNPGNMTENQRQTMVEIRHEMDNHIFGKAGKAVFIKLSSPGNEGNFSGFVLPAEAVKGLTIEKLAEALNLNYTGSKYYKDGKLLIDEIKVNIAEVSRNELDVPFSTEFDKHLITEHSRPEIKEGEIGFIPGVGNKKHLMLYNFPFSGSSLLPGKIVEAAALPESTVKSGVIKSGKDLKILSLKDFYNDLNKVKSETNEPAKAHEEIPKETIRVSEKVIADMDKPLPPQEPKIIVDPDGIAPEFLKDAIPDHSNYFQKIDELPVKGIKEKLNKAFEELPAGAKEFTAKEIQKIIDEPNLSPDTKVKRLDILIEEAQGLTTMQKVISVRVEYNKNHHNDEKLNLENEIKSLTEKLAADPENIDLKDKLGDKKFALKSLDNVSAGFDNLIDSETHRYKDLLSALAVEIKPPYDQTTTRVDEIIKTETFKLDGHYVPISEVFKSLDDFNITARRNYSELTEKQVEAIKAVSQQQMDDVFPPGEPNKKVVMVKVVVPGGNLELGGFVLTPKDLEGVKTIEDALRILKLDYKGSPFAPSPNNDGTYIVKATGKPVTKDDINIVVSEVTRNDVELPYLREYGGSKDSRLNDYPMTGFARLASYGMIGRPEYLVKNAHKRTGDDIKIISLDTFVRMQEIAPGLTAKPEQYKDIIKTIDDFHKIAKNEPAKAIEKLNEFKAKIEEAYPGDKQSPEKVKAYQLIQNELLNINLGQIKQGQTTDPFDRQRDVRMQLDAYNNKNPKIKLEISVMERAATKEFLDYATKGLEKIKIEPEKLKTPEGQKEFTDMIKAKREELINKWSQGDNPNLKRAEAIADEVIKIIASEVPGKMKWDSPEKKFMEKWIDHNDNELLKTEPEDDKMLSQKLENDLSAIHIQELEKTDAGKKLISVYESIPPASQIIIRDKVKQILENNEISQPKKEKIVSEIARATEAYGNRVKEIESREKTLKGETLGLKEQNKVLEGQLKEPGSNKSEIESQIAANTKKISENIDLLKGIKTTSGLWTEEKRLGDIMKAAEFVNTKGFGDPKDFTGRLKQVHELLPEITDKNGNQIFKTVEEFHLATRMFPSELSQAQRDGIKQMREAVSSIPPEGKKIIKIEVGGIYEQKGRGEIGGFVVEPEFLEGAKTKEDVIIKLLRLDYPNSPYLDDHGKLKPGIDVKISVATVKPDDVKVAYSKNYDESGMDILTTQYPYGAGGFIMSFSEQAIVTPEYKLNHDIKPEKTFHSLEEYQAGRRAKDPVFDEPKPQ